MGTIVLLLAAIVILPAVLDGDGIPSRDLESRVPARPADPEPLDVTPQRPVITADTDDLRLPENGLALNADETRDSSPDGAGEESPDVTLSVGTDEADNTADGRAVLTERTPDSPSLDPATGLPRAWSVQLGAFSNPANVETLVERLQEAGHPAYTRAIESSNGGLTGVYVGPLVDHDTAVSLQAELESTFELNGRVIRYRIEE